MSNISSDKILKEVLLAGIQEQRAKRRWNIFFRSLFFIFLFFSLGWAIFKNNNVFKKHAGNYAAVVDIKGIISADSPANADDITSGIKDAFKDPHSKGVILKIDSPGGSPVQASEIYNEILRQRNLHPRVKIYAVCTDVCASAAYYIACAANAIYVNPASLAGSIGVLADGFGFTGALDKLGIQRRLLTSGSHKDFMDPFSPLKDQDRKILQTMLNSIHQQFINDVIKGRGKRLKINADTFSGLVWTGQEAVNQGLADGCGSVNDIARTMLNTENIEDFTIKPNSLDLLAQRIGAACAVQLGEIIKTWDLK